MSVLLNSIYQIILKKYSTVSKKILSSSTTVNKKYFLSTHQHIRKNDFWRIMWHWSLE